MIDEPTSRHNTSAGTHGGYDDTGALYYVIAVVLMYGCSIVLMIGSSIKKSKNDNGVRKYMKDLDKIKRLARRQEKFKARLLMYGKRYHKTSEARSTPTISMDEQRTDSIRLSHIDDTTGDNAAIQTQYQKVDDCPMSSENLNVDHCCLTVDTPAPDDALHVSCPGQDMTVTPALIVPQQKSQSKQEKGDQDELETKDIAIATGIPIEV